MSSMTDIGLDGHVDDEPTRKKRRGRTLVALIVIIGLLIGGFVAYRAISKPALVRSIENSGFTDVTYFDGDPAKKITPSATAWYGQCELRFVLATQAVPGQTGMTVERVAIVESDGKLRFDTTPAELSGQPAYALCKTK
jgi:hypothetical protein